MPDTRHRVAVQLEDATYERIRVLAFQSRTTIPEMIRRCVDAQLEGVEPAVIPEIKGAPRPLTAKPNLSADSLRLNMKASKPRRPKS